LKVEFDFVLIVLAITFAIYAALYLFSLRTSEQYSPRGFLRHLFPSEVFRRARIDFSAYLIVKLAWAPAIAKVVAFFAFEEWTLGLLNWSFGERVLSTENSWFALLTQFLAFYFAYNFAFYWAHRWMHESRLLWSVHRTHHSAETLTFLTSGRVHPIEALGVALWTALWSGCAAAALSYYTGLAMHPLFPVVIYFWSILGDVADKLQHSHLRTSLGPLSYIMPLGAMHQIHHSAELKHRDKNFGNGSSVFDWMFGTIYIPSREEIFRLGLSEEELGARNPHNRVIDLYTEPFAYAWRSLRRSKMEFAGQPGIPSTSP
jgi:sterol desaturase/sphingolipid hydroxylase (fatty acid hydroxylase superfamily)